MCADHINVIPLTVTVVRQNLDNRVSYIHSLSVAKAKNEKSAVDKVYSFLHPTLYSLPTTNIHSLFISQLPKDIMQ